MNRTFKVFVGVLITLLAASSCMTLLEMGTISETKHANAKVKIPIEHLHNGVTNTTGASIVVTLVGEFGSHLNSLARGFGIQLLAKEAYDLDTNLVLKQPGSLKIRKNDRESEMAKKTKEDLQRCFPNLRKYSFYFGNSTEFKFRTSQQEGWEIANATLLQKINGPTLQEVKDAINHAKYLSEETTTKPQIIYHSDLILPLVNSQSKKEDVFVDQYYDEIRHWFEFDELECCKKVPDPDESVFVSDQLQWT